MRVVRYRARADTMRSLSRVRGEMMRSIISLFVALCLALGVTAEGASAGPADAQQSAPTRVMVLGDSLVVESAPPNGAQLERGGLMLDLSRIMPLGDSITAGTQHFPVIPAGAE